MSAKNVREHFGQGRLLGARQALNVGMIDEIATLDETVSKLAISPSSRPPIAAAFGAGVYELAEGRVRLGKLTC